jgi:type II secretory pathway pseudopilin PulG
MRPNKMRKQVFGFQCFSVQERLRGARFQRVGRSGFQPVASALKTENRKPKTSSAFTLFEVLIALGVFAIAVTGLAIALDSAVQAAFEARERALARIMLESRLSAAMSDPPLNGRRVIEARDNNGVRVEETLDVFEAKTTNGTPVPGLWKLKITADAGRGNAGRETAEILIYKP